MLNLTLVAVGGAIGACLRYLTDQAFRRRDSAFPWGTLTVNVVGSLILGFLTGAALTGTDVPILSSLVGIGCCGALTTFSTFGHETVRLFAEGGRLSSVVNVVGSVTAGLSSGAVGIALAAVVWA